MAYINAGAREAWLVYPEPRHVEMYGREGRVAVIGFAVDIDSVFRPTNR